jgi:hypothetical protein
MDTIIAAPVLIAPTLAFARAAAYWTMALSLYVVANNSMFASPSAHDTVVDNQSNFNDLKIGDIIAFKSHGIAEDT